MITLSQVYALPATKIPLTQFVLADTWFKATDLDFLYDGEVLQGLEADGRLEVLQLIYESADGYRYAAMYTVWLDKSPVFIVQQAGRGGQDYFNRWVTDEKGYLELLAYLQEFSASPRVEDVASPDKPLYEEAVFHFYGSYFGDKFGFPQEPRRKVLLMETRNILSTVDANSVLVLLNKADTVPLPSLIRRHDSVFEHVRQLTREELDADNPRINLHNDASGVDRVYLFRPCPNPPQGAVIQSV